MSCKSKKQAYDNYLKSCKEFTEYANNKHPLIDMLKGGVCGAGYAVLEYIVTRSPSGIALYVVTRKMFKWLFGAISDSGELDDLNQVEKVSNASESWRNEACDPGCTATDCDACGKHSGPQPDQPGPDEEDKWKWLLGLQPLRRDPIALDLDGDGVEFVKNGAYFDYDNNKFAEKATWIGKDDGWLALDKNGDGKIGDGSELFGEAMRKKDGTLAKDGFDALAEFDDNKDGKIDANDAIYSQLRVWQDANGNGITETTARRLPTKAVLSGKMVPAGR